MSSPITRPEVVHLQPSQQASMSMEMKENPTSSPSSPDHTAEEQPRLGMRGGGLVSDCVEAICCFECCKGLCDCCC